MNSRITRLYWKLRSQLTDTGDWFAKNCPVHVPTKRPACPNTLCVCGGTISKIIAIDTGDGYEMDWACDNDCGECEPIVGWWPLWWGVWVNYDILQRLGIEEA